VSAIRTRGNLRVVMRARGFRRLLGVRLVSQFADGLFQAALAGSLLFNPQQATGPVGVAAGFAVLLLPYSVVGPYVGVFLDRWSRRTVIYAANLIRAALVVPTVALIWFGRESAPYFLLALLIIGINRFFLAGLGASQPHVVPEDRLVTANSVAATLGTLVYSIGLGVAAFALNTALHKTFHGYALLAASAAFGYAGSALIARFSFERDALGPDAEERHAGPILGEVAAIGRGMVAGIGHLSRRRGAAYAMVAQSGYRILYGVLTLATLLLYRRYFYGDNSSAALSGLAQVVVAGGFGSLLAAFLTPPLSRRIGEWRWITVLLAGVGVMLAVLAPPFRPLLMVIATFCINIASQGIKIVVDTALQRDCDDDFRGRVFAVNDTTYNICFVIGLFTAALALPSNGRSTVAVALVALGYLVLAGWYGVAAARWAARTRSAEQAPDRRDRVTASG
jgi:hypothetical protein